MQYYVSGGNNCDGCDNDDGNHVDDSDDVGDDIDNGMNANVMIILAMGMMAMGKIVMSGRVASFRDRAERLSITCLQFDGSTNW